MDDTGVVSLSGDGKLLAIGDGSNVRVYRQEGASEFWSQIGAEIVGDKADNDVNSISFSYDGSLIAVGVPNDAGSNGVGSGRVRVYRLDDDEDAF